MLTDHALRRLGVSAHATALYGDLLRTLALALVVLTIVLASVYHTAAVRMMASSLHFNDFGKFYYSAKLAFAGGDMYGPSPATSMPFRPNERREFLNMNPPHFQLLVWPLTSLELQAAFVVWSALSVACLLWTLQLIVRELGGAWTWRKVLLVAAATLACSPTGATVITGQLSFFVALAMTGAWVAARRGRWSTSAAMLGVLVSLKPFFGLFLIYFAIRRSWSLFFLACGTGAAAVAAGVVAFGPTAYQQWAQALSAVDWRWGAMNGSIQGLLARSFAPSPFFTPIANLPLLSGFTASVISIALAFVAFVVLARHKTEPHPDAVFATLLVTAQLVSPLGWIYYLWCAVGPIAAMVGAGVANRAARIFLLLALPGLFCPIPLAIAFGAHGWASVTLVSIYSWATAMLWAAILIMDRRRVATDSRLPARV